MARRRRGSRRGFKIPIITVGILAGQVFAAGSRNGWNPMQTLDEFQSYYTGFDISTATFRPANLAAGYIPWLAKRFLLPIARPRLPVKGLPISIS